MNDSTLTIFGAFATIITSFLTYKIGKKKANAIAQKTELENVSDAIRIWRETAESFAVKSEKQSHEMHILIQQNKELLAQNKVLVSKIERLEREIEKLKKSV
jgi:hypothetical protein